MTSQDINTVELGTIVRDDEKNKRRWIAVECWHPEREFGCRKRRWAQYHGPSRLPVNYRLCPEDNLTLARSNNALGPL